MCSSVIPCPLCSQPAFANSDSLRLALVSVATRHLPCPVCGELFLGLDKLTIHMFGHLHGLVQEKVQQVQQEVPINLVTPTKLHSCDICGFKFNNGNILQMHKDLVHSSKFESTNSNGQVVQLLQCHLCSKKFRTRGSLMIHLRVVHFGFPSVFDKDKGVDEVGDDSGVVCDVCRKVFATQEQMQGHLKVHDVNNNVGGGNKQWECEVCSKMFTTKYFLKKHKRLHTGEMPYHCTQCNKAFTFQQSYHKHMLYHSSEKPHTCGQCGRAFKELSTLHNHERIHSGERPFSCETCGKCFRQRVSCLVHRRIHTGAMPYHCTACGKKFRYKVSQRTHKCPAQPPGVVVRSSEPDDPPPTPQKFSLTIAPSYTPTPKPFELPQAVTTPTPHLPPPPSPTIIPPRISPPNINSSPLHTDRTEQPTDLSHKEDDTETHLEVIKNTDFFSLVMSPVMDSTNVMSPTASEKFQHLCLSNSSSPPLPMEQVSEENHTNILEAMCQNHFSNQENDRRSLQTINEESLKELLYGDSGRDRTL